MALQQVEPYKVREAIILFHSVRGYKVRDDTVLTVFVLSHIFFLLLQCKHTFFILFFNIKTC
jgi:hypothetical protein